MTNIFDKDKIGRNLWCRLEKDGIEKIGLVRWIHCHIGGIVDYKEMVKGIHMVKTGGWKIKEIDVVSSLQF